MTCAPSRPSLSLSEQAEMTPPASDDPQAPPPGSGPSRAQTPVAPRTDGRDGGGAERRAGEGSLATVIPAMALLLLSAVISGWDADVTRKKRGPRARAEAPSSWWAFRLPVPSPPARAPRCCDDCSTAETGQWRAGPLGPGTLCNTCGARRWAHGERWGLRRRRRRAATATTVSHQPPPPQESRPDSKSLPDGQICKQGLLAPVASPKLVTSLPPATESFLPAPPATAMAAGSEQLPPPPPPEIPASQSSPQYSTDGNQIARSKPAKRKSPSASPPPPEIPASQSPPLKRPDGNRQKARWKPAAKRSSPSPLASPATAGKGSEQPAPQEIRAASENSRHSPPKKNKKPVTKRNSACPSPAPATARTGSEQPQPQAEVPAASENSHHSPLKKKNYKKAAAERQCVHCGSKTTSQWRREGHDRRRTLCNACGVRHRQGRLLPEYRPKTSPTFDKKTHASLHSKVLKLRRQRRDKEQQQPPALAQHHQQQPVVDGDSANNAGASSSSGMATAGPVGNPGRLQLDPFLLDGPAAPIIVKKE
ncbi:unnamed protein product [Urochloa decumbens]|uniref:GATA-type domain-containing protein n=1 Tax=Urochloa decumbens TaxID=240449 RepID=A0ABC8WKK8_9POAL